MFRLKINKVIIFLGLLIAFTSNVNAIVKPTDDFYVNDYANILSKETENYILNKSVQLNNIDGSQIVVVTVEDLEGMTIEEYSLELFRTFGIGDSENNNGLLFLISLEERKFRIEVGYGLEGVLSDAKVGRFQDQYIIPYITSGKFDEGIRTGYDVFYSEIYNNLNYDKVENRVDIKNYIYVVFLILNILVGIILGLFLKKREKKLIFIYIIILGIISMVELFMKLGEIWILFLCNVLSFWIIYSPKTLERFLEIVVNNSYVYNSSSRNDSKRDYYNGNGGSSGGGGTSRKF